MSGNAPAGGPTPKPANPQDLGTGTKPDAGTQPDINDAAPQYLIDAVEKWQGEPTDANKELATQALNRAKAASEAAKKAAEAGGGKKPQEPQDYSKLNMPEKLSVPDPLKGWFESHKTELVNMGKANKVPVADLQDVLARDNDLLGSYLAEVEKHNLGVHEKNLTDLKGKWGQTFEANTQKVNTLVEFYEKQVPGFKSAIDRVKASNDPILAQVMLLLHDHLSMSPDFFQKNPKATTAPAGMGALFTETNRT